MGYKSARRFHKVNKSVQNRPMKVCFSVVPLLGKPRVLHHPVEGHHWWVLDPEEDGNGDKNVRHGLSVHKPPQRGDTRAALVYVSWI